MNNMCFKKICLILDLILKIRCFIFFIFKGPNAKWNVFHIAFTGRAHWSIIVNLILLLKHWDMFYTQIQIVKSNLLTLFSLWLALHLQMVIIFFSMCWNYNDFLSLSLFFIFEEGVDFCRVEIFLFNTLIGNDKSIKN